MKTIKCECGSGECEHSDRKFLWSYRDKVIILNVRGATELMAKLKAFLDRGKENSHASDGSVYEVSDMRKA
uniref:Uncharacterized protein n=1 Tax=viral metagenome TaxID=1070528 RepID=A0A6M3IMG4_9ZZZZ